jgi:ABC-2 type transport system ATP-binding protein
MIHVDDVAKSYGSIEALRGISFDVHAGEIVGLLGPNGAGKSTAIKILTGFLHPDRGIVQVDGRDVLTDTRAVQSRIGYLSENTPLYPELSVQSYLKLMADLRGIPKADQLALLSEAIYAANLGEYLARPISKLSKGVRQRVGLAQAILHRPRMLILDEPTIGLDPTQIVDVRRLIKRLAEDSTILFSSHILSEVEALCDRVIIIINGQVKADARLDELNGTSDVILILQKEPDGAHERLAALGGVENIEAFQSYDGYPAYRLTAADDLVPVVYETAREQGWPVREIRRDTATLETVFNELATTVSGEEV